jgi:NADPH:quinone reductase-like Zn-dependent oxidoreductase
MKAVQLSRFGDPDALEIIELPIPSPEPSEVLIRIRAAGVNFFKTLVRQNRYAVTPKLPIVSGVEAAATNRMVSKFSKRPPFSMFRRYSLLPAVAHFRAPFTT